jgi:hypothetical protein
MATDGWTARNAAAQLAMFDLAGTPQADAGWVVAGHGQLRLLADATYTTSFWTRSSPDGRFVAHGVADVPGSYVRDLQRGVLVPIAAEYDPAFFPDATGFVFQGGPRNTCPESVLTSNPSAIAMTEPGCRAIGEIGLYQHVGSTGGDAFALDGLFVSDDGGKLATTSDPAASFGAHAYAAFTPLVFDGTSYAPRAAVRLDTPFEGDAVLSPSAGVMISRLEGPSDQQLGYVLRRVDATPSGATYAISTPEIARYCTMGGKPAFSYDERWLAFHHYESTGAANVYLMELSTGVVAQITNMRAGQYALYPHFRSDGWLYIQVRDTTTGHEYTIASDAALQ